MSTINVDRNSWTEIVHNNNECIDLKEKLHRISRIIDRAHKRAQFMFNTLDKDNPNHVKSYNEMLGNLKGLEFIAQQMENLFKVTVLTEPRE